MKRSIVFFLCLQQLLFSAIAQSGTLDLTFGTDGKTIDNVTTDSEVINAIALKPDDGIVAVGMRGDQLGMILASYTSDGDVDDTFGTSGSVVTNFGVAECAATAIALDALGRIVVTGWATVSGSTTGILVARFLSDGALDTSFSGDGWLIEDLPDGSARGYGVAIQDDGKILVCGYAGTMTLLMRYGTQGTLDATFGDEGIALADITGSNDRAYALAIGDDGKIVLAGDGYEPSLTSQVVSLSRFNNDGSLDEEFAGVGYQTMTYNSSTSHFATDVALTEDGYIFISGYTDGGGGNVNFAGAKFLPNGDLDPSFSGDGIVTLNVSTGADPDRAEGLVIQEDGKIILAGWADMVNIDFAMMRFLPDGTNDPSFGVNGKTTSEIGSGSDRVNDIAIGSDGKVVLAGSATVSGADRFALARYNALLPCDLFPAPGSLEVTYVGSDVQFNWDADGDGPFMIRYREQGTIDWIELADDLIDTVYLASAFSPCEAYEFQVGVNCTDEEVNFSGTVLLEPTQQAPPVIAPSGPTTICAGDSIVLTSSYAENNLWSTGDTDQSITVTEAGTYDLTVSGVCEELFAETVTVETIDPELPVTETYVIFNGPGTVVLTATGDSILWYDQPSGAEPIGSGSPWETPFLNSSSTFWVSNVLIDGELVCESERVEVTIDITLGVASQSIENVQIYPNPTDDRIFVIVPLEWYQEDLELRIHDLGGRFLIGHNLQEGRSMIMTTDLSNGTYFLSIRQSDRMIKIGKLVVIR